MLRGKAIQRRERAFTGCKGNGGIILTVRDHALEEILNRGIVWEKDTEAEKKIWKNEKCSSFNLSYWLHWAFFSISTLIDNCRKTGI